MLVVTGVSADAQRRGQRRNLMRETSAEFFRTPEARRVGDQIMAYQRVTGGWPKNIDMTRPMSAEELDKVMAQKSRRDDSTTDNSATTTQMQFLARLYDATGDTLARDAFRRGVEFLLSGQYERGGWPQFWPDPKGYQIHVTYNDDAMVNTMLLLRDIAEMKAPYSAGLTDEAMRARCMKAFDKGVQCMLDTQIRNSDGDLTIWCQQHDRDTYLPASARAYELPSYSPPESSRIVGLLMSLPEPDDRVKQAVHSAMKWFDKYKLTGIALKHFRTPAGRIDRRIEADDKALPMWGRYYDLVECQPYVCDRDGIPRRHLENIGYERRNGYSWFSTQPRDLYALYDSWADRYDPANKIALDLTSPGANVTGTVDMDRRPAIEMSAFDAVVNPGESIQAALERAPEGTAPYKVLIRNGVYNEKVIIDRPNVILVGENRDSTIICIAETEPTNTVKEYNGKKVHHGVVVIMEGADDCVISGLTVYNNYGTTVENTTTHQMAIYGRADRTIVINSNVWADGNDALSLWMRNSGGMYYHADLDLRCRGVDFLCPRGWCYATRCKFTGDGHAMIWHDGRGDPDKKLVITNSTFDALSPTPLGRYHHDSQFYLVHCDLSANVSDSDIRYAYTDKVLDPCPWGQRTYFFGCMRDGGHNGWLADNLSSAPDAPEFHGVTAGWTFAGKWDPEKRIRDLWNVLAY